MTRRLMGAALAALLLAWAGLALAAPVEEMHRTDKLMTEHDGATGDIYLLTKLKSLLACEDLLGGVCKTEERYSTIPVGGTDAMIAADQLYKSGPGYVRGIDCYGTDSAATAGTIALRDNTVAGAGNILWSRTILAADYSIAGIKADLQAAFSVGLFLDFTTTADMACAVRFR